MKNDEGNDYTGKNRFNVKQFENYFEKFCLLYPIQNESNREESKQLFKKLFIQNQHELIICILRNQINVYKYKQAKKIFVPFWKSMANWLKNESWLDEIKIPTKRGKALEENELIENQVSDKKKYEQEEKETRIGGDQFIREWYERNKKYGKCPLDICDYTKDDHKKRVQLQMRKLLKKGEQCHILLI